MIKNQQLFCFVNSENHVENYLQTITKLILFEALTVFSDTFSSHIL